LLDGAKIDHKLNGADAKRWDHAISCVRPPSGS